MKTAEIKMQLKLTALNKIRKIYHPKYKFPYSEDGSGKEQKERAIERIIEDLEEDLLKLKNYESNKT